MLLEPNDYESSIKAFENAIAMLESENAYDQVLDCYGQILSLLTEQAAPLSLRQKYITDAAQKINKFSSDLLSEGHYKQVVKLLKRIEGWLEPYPNSKVGEIKNFMYNSLACAHKRLADLKTSANYIEKAVKVCEDSEDIPHSAMTFLNASAVLSELGHHRLAFERATQAVRRLESGSVLDPNSYDKWTLLGMAHYNIALQEEILHGGKPAVQSYNTAIKFLMKSPQIDSSLLETFQIAKKRVEEKMGPPSKMVRADTLNKKTFKVTPRKNRPQSARQKLGLGKSKKSGMNLGLPQTTTVRPKIKINYFSIQPPSVTLASSASWLSPRGETKVYGRKSPILATPRKPAKVSIPTEKLQRHLSWKGPSSTQASVALKSAEIEKLKVELRKELEQDIEGEKPKMRFKVNNFVGSPERAISKEDSGSEKEISELRKHGALSWEDNKVEPKQVSPDTQDEKLAEDKLGGDEKTKERKEKKPKVRKININMGGQKPVVLLASGKIIKHGKCLSMPFINRKRIVSASPNKPRIQLPRPNEELPTKKNNNKKWTELHKCTYNSDNEVHIRQNQLKGLLEIKMLDKNVPAKLLFGMRQQVENELSPDEARNIWEETVKNTKKEIATDCANFFKKIKENFEQTAKDAPVIMINNKVINEINDETTKQPVISNNANLKENDNKNRYDNIPEEIKEVKQTLPAEDDIKPLAGRMPTVPEPTATPEADDTTEIIRPLTGGLEKIVELSPAKENDATISRPTATNELNNTEESLDDLVPLTTQRGYTDDFGDYNPLQKF